MSERIKGQEVEVIVVVDGEPQSTVTTVRSFEVAIQMETKSEGYLGETTNRKDDIFNGVRGRIEFHIENDDVFKLIKSIVDRARRRVAGTVINIKATLRFPNGDRPRVLVPDVKFGEIPISFGSRSDYGSLNLDFESSDYQVIG